MIYQLNYAHLKCLFIANQFISHFASPRSVGIGIVHTLEFVLDGRIPIFQNAWTIWRKSDLLQRRSHALISCSCNSLKRNRHRIGVGYILQRMVFGAEISYSEILCACTLHLFRLKFLWPPKENICSAHLASFAIISCRNFAFSTTAALRICGQKTRAQMRRLATEL